jgi:hypothetical protein
MWTHGEINGYVYQVKYYETASEYGINRGKISKMSIRKDGKEIYNYERGLDFDDLDAEGRMVYASLLERFN